MRFHGWRAWAAASAAVLGSLALAGPALAATKPVEGGSQANNTSLSGALAVATQGTVAWTAAYDTGQLTGVDFSNASAPTLLGTTAGATLGGNANTLENATNVTIAGSYAYVVSKNRNTPAPPATPTGNDDGNGDSLTIVDISNSTKPIVVGSVDDPSTTNSSLFGAYGVAVGTSGGRTYAYVASQGLLSGQPTIPQTSTGSFDVIDVTTPTQPKIVASLYNNSLTGADANALDHATSVAISGNYAYVTASYDHTLTVIDISHPTSPQIVATLSDSTNLYFDVDVTIQGNYAYVADQVDSPMVSMAAVDISDPLHPHVVGELASTWLAGAYRIRVQGDFAYVAAHDGNNAAIVDISDPTHPVLATGLNDPAYFANTTGVAVDATGQTMLLTTPDVSNAGNLIGATTAVTLDPASNSVTITPSSEPPSWTTQTSANFAFTFADSVASASCYLDNAPTPCTTHTTASLSGLSPGYHMFQVDSTDAAGNVAHDSYSWAIDAPVNTAAPTIAGTPTQSQTLDALQGTWLGSAPLNLTNQWEDCDQSGGNCTPIAGATGSTYTVQPSDGGSTIEVWVTGSNTSGQMVAASAPTAVVSSPPANRTAPMISGTPTQGQTLTATNGTWTGFPAPSFSYQWQDCPAGGGSCSPIGAANSSSYTLQASDVGLRVDVVVKATNTVSSVTATSPPTGVVQASTVPAGGSPPANSAPPSISGTPAQGRTLTAAAGTWSGSPTFSYGWERCNAGGGGCSAIAGASASSYTPAAADVGSTIEVVITAFNQAGSTSARSPHTAAVAAPAGQVARVLGGALVPGGAGSTISSVLGARGYTEAVRTLWPGGVTIDWYFVPDGAVLASLRRGSRHHPKPVLVAAGHLAFNSAGRRTIKLKLTRQGHSLLAHAASISLTGQATFTPRAGAALQTTRRFKLFRARAAHKVG
jgi:hypothetical protein